MLSRQGKSYLFGLATIGLWSTVATACKLSLRYLTPAELVFYSSLTSCIVLAVILAFQGKLTVLKAMGRPQWLLALKLGILNPFLYYLILFKAYDLLPAQQAQPINYTWAITLSLLAVPLLGHRLGMMQLLAICISYFGVLVISTGGHPLSMQFDSPLGVFLAILSTVFWALYWIANTKDTRDPVVGLFMNFLCAVPCIALYLLLFQPLRLVDPRGLAGAVYLGFFEMGIAFLFWLAAMKLTDNTARIANLIFLSPFLSLVFIYFLVGETIRPSTLWGLVFIIAGLIVQGRARSEAAKPV